MIFITLSLWISSLHAGNETGIPHSWAPAAKQAVGSTFEGQGADSPIWFTIQSGILTEVFYPAIDQIQVGDLQLLITDGVSFFSEQKKDVLSKVKMDPEGMGISISGKDRSDAYEIQQEIATEPDSPVLRIRTLLTPRRSGLRAYVLFKPAIRQTGSNDRGKIEKQALVATETDAHVAAAVMANVGWKKSAVGLVGINDGWQDLSKNFVLTETARSAGPGNIALTGELDLDLSKPVVFEIALAFDKTATHAITVAKTALSNPFETSFQSYRMGWKAYLDRLNIKNNRERISAAVIKMHEDKTERGAIIASMSTPGIPDHSRAPENNQGGYHLVWPRDLYHAAIGLLSAGDLQTPVDVLKFLRSRQKPDGSWYQNFHLDGRPYWKAVQMDQVAFPILLAEMVRRHNIPLQKEDLEMIRKAADFIMARGPTTEQDRWEEIGGYIPSSIAAQIAALRVASKLVKNPLFLRKATEWEKQIESWTVVTKSDLGKNYYTRVSRTGTPNHFERIDIANNGGQAWNWEILDGGFLDLVRLGIRSANHTTVLSTLAIYDHMTPELKLQGVFRRYNRDAYGPNHQGGYWPVLAGERGEYAVAAKKWDQARSQLAAMESASTDTGLIPEQVIGFSNGQAIIGEGAPCPLVWSHAEHLRLARSIRDQWVFDLPLGQ